MIDKDGGGDNFWILWGGDIELMGGPPSPPSPPSPPTRENPGWSLQYMIEF